MATAEDSHDDVRDKHDGKERHRAKMREGQSPIRPVNNQQ
jgi:hypothetical protein